MTLMTRANWVGDGRVFPCPLCKSPLGVRESKKKKPYVICDPCGIQLFVRNPAGTDAFNELVDRAADEDLWTLLARLKESYEKQCPSCGHKFWVKPELIQTSWVDGSLEGFRCPRKGCRGIVKWKE